MGFIIANWDSQHWGPPSLPVTVDPANIAEKYDKK
jgi:hypothetical protein